MNSPYSNLYKLIQLTQNEYWQRFSFYGLNTKGGGGVAKDVTIRVDFIVTTHYPPLLARLASSHVASFQLVSCFFS